MSSSDFYTIVIRNGERVLTATNLRLSITVLGREENLSAGPFRLRPKGWLMERHHGDDTEVYTDFDATKDIGDIVAIRLEAQAGWQTIFTPIFIHWIRVRQPSHGQDCLFALSTWIKPGDRRLFFCGRAQYANAPGTTLYMSQLRNEDLAYWRSVYDCSKMQRASNLPTGMSRRYWDLPDDEQFLSVKARQVFAGIATDIADTLRSKMVGNHRSWDSFDSMQRQFSKNGRLLTPLADVWKKDWTMARSFVSGLNPCLIKLCPGALPEGFPVTVEDLLANVPALRHRDVAADLTAGRFCYIDFRPFLQDFVDAQREYRMGTQTRASSGHGILLNTIYTVLNMNENRSEKYLAAPICLFYHDAAVGGIVPVAIQLKRDGRVYYPVTDSCPSDQQNEWLLVKMWVNNADTQVHQLRTHFLCSHLIPECFALAMRRSLSPAHPVYRLLKPQLQNVMAMNALARQRLIPVLTKLFSIGDDLLALVKKCYGLWSYDDMSPTKELRRNGFGPDATTPLVQDEGAYPWREDVLLIWGAIKRYVRDYLAIYYDNDAQVANDTELNQFRLELQNLLPGKSLPEIRTVKDVAKMAARIVYMSSAGHAAVNFNQYEHYSWQPSHPTVMRMPIPEEILEPITQQVILNTVPNITQTVQTVALARVLSDYSADEVYLGKMGDQDLLQNDPQARTVFDQFSCRLDDVSETIRKRNATSRTNDPYVYLLPSMIPNSVAI